MKIFIQASELNLNPERLKKMIPPEKLESLKGKGILQAYLLAHEGISRPKILGEGQQELKWPKSTIHRLCQKIKEGTKFFIHHNEDNSHDDRKSVGEVLVSVLENIKGKLSNIVVGYFPDKNIVSDMNTCSMEADVDTSMENIVGDINEVTGIALGNSDKENPAFPGAIRLSTVQCFDIQNKKPGEGDKQVTFEELKTGIRELNIRPWQVFTLDDFKNDRVFGKLFEENSTLKAENERLNKDNKEIVSKNEKALRLVDVSKAEEKIKELTGEGYTDKQIEFIMGRFNPETMEDLTDKGLETFLEESKKDFADTAKLFGVAEKSDASAGKEKKEGEEEEGDLSMEAQALKEIGVKI